MSETKSTNPKDLLAIKKSPLELIPSSGLIHTAQAFKEGVKYGAFNWRTEKVGCMTYIGAAKRHIEQFVDGENFDPKASIKKHHLAGAIASLMIILDAWETENIIDDRPPRGNASNLLDFYEDKK